MPGKEEIREEDRKIRYLQRLSDLTFALIRDTDMSLDEASRHVASLKEFAIKLFPGKGHVFDLVYGPRFRRLMNWKYRLC